MANIVLRHSTNGLSKPHILIAEDDILLHTIFRTALSISGYRLSFVGDGATAVAAIEAEPARFQCVVMDIVMPKVDGVQAAQAIHLLQPQLPIILMSGEVAPKLPEDLPVVALLEKPFRIDRLVQLVASHTTMVSTKESGQSTFPF